MFVIAISNRKGGAGKTTVAVNLAAEFSSQGKRVLLLDLDSQCHCSVALGIKQFKNSVSVHSIFTDTSATVSSAILPTFLETLWIAPGNPFFNHGEGERDPKRLRNAIQNEQLEKKFDLIVIDTPPSLDDLLMNGIFAATHILIPFLPHHLSLEGVRQLIRALFPIMSYENRSLKILGFVPIMASERIKLHIKITEEIARNFGNPKMLYPIRTDIRLAEAFAAGKPIKLYAPNSRGAEDFKKLSEEVEEKLITLYS